METNFCCDRMNGVTSRTGPGVHHHHYLAIFIGYRRQRGGMAFFVQIWYKNAKNFWPPPESKKSLFFSILPEEISDDGPDRITIIYFHN